LSDLRCSAAENCSAARTRHGWLPFDYSAYDYIVGVLVAVLIMALANVRLPTPRNTLESSIRWLAGTSFGLYLLHYRY
jgi:peptidoglycan/LPS O-acetylase OafA/YrhL